MIRKQRVGIVYTPEQRKRLSKLFDKIGEKFNFEGSNYLFFEEGEKRFQFFLKLLRNDNFEYHLMEFREYLAQEINNAKLLQLTITTYCGIGSSEYGNVFDDTNVCKYCGSGKELILPLKINKKQMGKKDIAITYQFETIISERLAKILKVENVMDYKLSPVKHYTDKMNGEQVLYQLMITNMLPTTVEPTRFKKDKYCEHCGKRGLFLDSELYYSKKELTSWKDFNNTKEVFGYANTTNAKSVIVISQRLYQIFKKNKIKNIKVEPIHFIQ